MVKTTLTGTSMDLFSPEARRDPYPYYRALRHGDPVHYFEQHGVWAVSRYADVMMVLRRPDLFSSAGAASFESTLLGSDPPAHSRARRIVSGFFTGRRIADLEGRVQMHTDRLVDRFVGRGRCELMSDLASPLPLLVIAELLGIDPERAADFKRWSTAIVVGASGTLSPDESREAEKSMAACHAFFGAHVERCRQSLETGILHDFLLVGHEGDTVTDEEAVELGKLLLVAGNETTTNLIGNCVHALLRYPVEAEAVRANPDLISPLIEETLRFDSPAQMVQRRATADVELGGARIPAGARVLVLLGSANHDDDQFPDPERFMVTRNPQGHIAFGFGAHYCLGSHIARLEARIVLQALFARMPGLRADQPLDSIEFVDSIHVRGPRQLKLAFGSVVETSPRSGGATSAFSRLIASFLGTPKRNNG